MLQNLSDEDNFSLADFFKNVKVTITRDKDEGPKPEDFYKTWEQIVEKYGFAH